MPRRWCGLFLCAEMRLYPFFNKENV